MAAPAEGSVLSLGGYGLDTDALNPLGVKKGSEGTQELEEPRVRIHGCAFG